MFVHRESSIFESLTNEWKNYIHLCVGFWCMCVKVPLNQSIKIPKKNQTLGGKQGKPCFAASLRLLTYKQIVNYEES